MLIIYDSQTGNTEKMAFGVSEGVEEVKGAEPILRKVDQATLNDLQDTDAIIIGSPTYFGQMSGKLKTFIDTSASIHGKLAGKAVESLQVLAGLLVVQKPHCFLY